ncbi:hypothetical protein [Flavobacterium marginilacus]|uniref:hypothetical protein n=1 Tax=Flavobacterium marginilacus TaxID=3003256 RepID=UPI00248D4B53|nr:hypothetical protein [Flavobacterium marginilacus]
MARIFTVLLICLLFFNCKKEESEQKNISYIISKENKERIKGNYIIPPPPPIPGWLFYGTDTFIINSDTTAYYMKNKGVGFVCGTMTADTIPYFADLNPRDLIEISNKNIFDFIKLNYNDDFRNATFIASNSDTIDSEIFFDLYKALNIFKKDRDFIAIRRTTQEEDTVIFYKRNNKTYYSGSIQWDKTKIKFPK